MPKKRFAGSKALLRLAELRSQAYSFLSSVYTQIPSHDFVNRLRGEDTYAFLSGLSLEGNLPREMEEGLAIIKEFIRASKDGAIEGLYQSLSVERTRLFRGINYPPHSPPPYECLYRGEGGLLMGKSAVEVKKKYAEAGVFLPDDYKEPPDFIGLELDFMRFLAQEEARAWSGSDRDSALKFLNIQQGFLSEHIVEWVPRFCDSIAEEAKLDFYRGIVKMTKAFVMDDYAKMEDIIRLAKQSGDDKEFNRFLAAPAAVAGVGNKLLEAPPKVLVASAAPGEVAEETWVPFWCNQCGMGPDLARACVVNGVVTKVEGNLDFGKQVGCPSMVCVKAYGLVQKLYNPYRIKAPMKRTNPKKGIDEDPGFMEISWEEALDIFTGKLKEIREKGIVDQHGLPRVAQASQIGPAGRYYEGAGWTPFWTAWGPTDRLGGGGGIKCFHAEHVYGEMWRRAFVNAPDFRLCNYEIVFGRNQNVTMVQLGAIGFTLYADARARGMKHIHISPNQCSTAAKADEWIPIRIKTDSAFLLAMVHVILYEMDWREVCDIEFLKKMTASPYLVGPHGYYVRDPGTKKPLVWDASVSTAKPYDEAQDFALEGTYPVSGIEIGPDGETYTVEEGKPSFQLLLEHVKDYTPEWASKICDVPAETMRRITREFVKHAEVGATIEIEGVKLPYRPASIVLGKGVNNGWGAYQCVWAQHILLMLVGALEVPGGNLGCYARIYRTVPFTRDSDGLLLMAPLPTDKERWEWPPKTRPGTKTLTPLAGPGPAYFGADSIGWKSFTEPLEKWPASIPDIYVLQRTDVVSSQYDSNLIRRAIEKIPFVVSFAYVLSDSNWYADLLLPESIDIESLQLAAVLASGKGAWDHSGWAIRQPVTKPLFNTRDITDIWTELADRLGMLSRYNAKINEMLGLREPWKLTPDKKYSVEEIVDRECKSVTEGEYGLEWFKKNGAKLWPMSKLTWYLHVNMAEKGIRYRLPYQAEIKRIGEELKRRLNEVGIHWWDRQAEDLTHAFPKWNDFSAIYQEVFQADPEYDLWLTCHRTHQFAWAHNADVPWLIETGKDTLDVPGVLINPRTAKKKGLKSGDRVCIESRFGKTEANTILSETVRPEVLEVCEHFGTKNPITKRLGWPNMNETERIDIRLIDETGSSSDHTIVKIYKV